LRVCTRKGRPVSQRPATRIAILDHIKQGQYMTIGPLGVEDVKVEEELGGDELILTSSKNDCFYPFKFNSLYRRSL
jgi:hypothetical protein